MIRIALGRLTAIAALAVIFITPDVASAFPIQNNTITTVDSSQREVHAIYGTVVGGGKKGKQLNVGGLYTQAKSMDVKQLSVKKGNVLFGGGQTVRAYSMELTGSLKTTQITTRIEAVAPAASLQPQNLSTYVPNSGLAAQRAAWVVSHYGQGNVSSIQAAAVQLAVWNIMYQSGTTYQGDVYSGSAFNVGSSHFASADLANQYLMESWNGGSYALASGFIFRQGVNLDGTVNKSHGQDLLYASSPQILLATPEPSTIAIASLGGIGFLGFCGRRKRVKV